MLILVIGIFGFIFMGGFVFYRVVMGGFSLLFDFEKFIKFSLLIILVLLDIFFVMGNCRHFWEACIHLLILSLPFLYLFRAGKG